MSPEYLLAGVLAAALVLYALGGGADFGGGVWDLFASGPRAARQREEIARAIGPIWEANHVWLVLVVVLLFVGFPRAFAALSVALHLPITLMLAGIVLRGSAFTFRAYDSHRDDVQRRWGATFAIASVIAPTMLGVCAGAVLAGRVRMDPVSGHPVGGYFAPWCAPFPFAVGLFALALCAFLAATYLTVEADDDELRRDFRVRALISGVACGVLAWGCVALAKFEAPSAFEGLLRRPGALALQIVAAAVAIGALVALVRERWALARILAAVQVAVVVAGWAFAQHPYVLPPDLTLHAAAAPRSVIVPVLWVLGAGAAVLLPALAWLFAVFKRRGSAGVSKA